MNSAVDGMTRRTRHTYSSDRTSLLDQKWIHDTCYRAESIDRSQHTFHFHSGQLALFTKAARVSKLHASTFFSLFFFETFLLSLSLESSLDLLLCSLSRKVLSVPSLAFPLIAFAFPSSCDFLNFFSPPWPCHAMPGGQR